MQDHIRLGFLIDCYGSLLTDRQLSLISLSANEDLSLAEIAAREGISRQGVRDAVKRAQEQLEDYESKLGLLRFRMSMTRSLRELMLAIEENGDERLKEMAERLWEICEDGI